MSAQLTTFYDDTKSPEPASTARAPAPFGADAQSEQAANKPQIGWCGLGAMGFGMATHLVKQNYPVKGFDVFHGSREKLEAAGGISTTSLAKSAEGCLYYVCMVATAQQAQDALFDPKDSIVQSLPEGATLLLCSTVPASYAIAVQRQLKTSRPDIYFVDCPVSGGATRAANGTLSIMAGADDEAMTKAEFLLDEMTEKEKLYIVPGGVGQGSNMKMAHQVLAAIHILATSEAMGFAARLGLDLKELRDTIVGDGSDTSQAWSWMFENRTPRILTEDYVPGVSALTIILKDVGIITTAAREVRFNTRLCMVAEQTYLLAVAQGYGAQDDAGMVRMYFPESVTSTQAKSSAEEKDRAMALAQNVLVGIHLCATVEAISFAATLNLPMDQFFKLVNSAAGSSTTFRSWSQLLEGQRATPKDLDSTALLDKVPTADLERISEGLTAALSAGQNCQCPLPLVVASYDMLLAALKRRSTNS